MILIVLPIYSQVDIKKDSVTLPFYVAQGMHIDLLDYDRLVENDVENNLNKCIDINKKKDSIAATQFLQLQVANEQNKTKDTKIEFLEFKIDNTAKKKGNGLAWFGGGTVVGILLTLFATK